MTVLSHSQPANDVGLDLDALEEIQRRVLWLAVRMVDHANNDRPSGEVKVGGHQASSASIVGIMTSLWFGHLGPDDKVAVKPHASPVLHSLNYLIGALDGSYLTRLRELGGLQAYPSRTKDPDVHDFSLGSVGLGVVAPLFAAAARRYVDAHFGAPRERPPRFIALVGDAELDEGNVWEAIADPALQGLGNVMWVIDTNRQSLDRVVPDQKIKKLMNHFAAAGWHVVEAKYGSKLQAAFERPGGDELRRHVDGMSNEQYQSLFGLTGPELRERFLLGASTTLAALVDEYGDDDLAPLVQDLAGHDLAELIRCYRRCDEVTDRPSVVFAYTVKGWGLPVAGDPLNHAALLPRGAIDDLRRSLGLTPESEWDRFAPDTSAGSLCSAVGQLLQRPAPTARPVVNVPISVLGSSASSKPVSSQEAFGRLLLRLADQPDVRSRLVTTSPDVSVSTNLGGWINKVGVFHPDEQPDFLGDGRLLRWKQTPAGHHIELGISEMNLFLLLHAARARPGAPRPAAPADRHRLRPVRLPRPRCPHLRALQRGALRARRYAVGRDARPRGRRPPVDDHAFDRPRAPRPHVRRAVLRAGVGLAPLRRPRAPVGSRRGKLVSAAVHETDRPGAVRGGDGATEGRTTCAVTSSPAGTACGRAAPGRRRSCSPRAGPSYPRYSPPRACSRPRGCPRSSWTSRVRAVCIRSGGGRCGAPAAAPALPHRRSTSRASSSRMSDACRS